MKKVDFKCPKCFDNRLEEVMVNVTVASTLKSIYIEEGQANFDYDEQTNEDGEVERFQCANCGTTLKLEDDTVVSDLDLLAQWFEEQSDT